MNRLALEVTRGLVMQQLAGRYRRTWIGVAWLMLVPLANMLVIGVALSAVMRVRSLELVAHVIVSSLPFTLFQGAVLSAAQSLLAYQDIIRRHAVHRIVFPASALAVAVIEYLVASLSLIPLGLALGLHVKAVGVFVPLGLMCVVGAAAGVGLVAAVVTVYFRDFGPLLQMALNLLYWLTPIVYTRDMLPENLRGWLDLNPLAAILRLYTDPLIHGVAPPIGDVLAAVGCACALFAVGWTCFARVQRTIVFHL